ncbi:hypothetical protein [Nonomuraea sp. JJY05]|uniref:hypothetical protein n=1 Tax=Nonomuraea sp. JJY05 TaxID=3350255 RepID=UPI00373F16C5
MNMTFAIVPTPARDVQIAILVPAQAASVAASLSPEAVTDAKELLADRGWCDAAEVAEGAELLALIDDALASRDVFLCEVCRSRVTDNTHTYGYSEETVAVCEHCGDR